MHSELIARLEAATGPDRELDLRVKSAVYGGVVLRSPFNCRWCLYREGTTDPRTGEAFARPRRVDHQTWINDRYTASIDAAVTLVPDGWGWLVRDTGHARCMHPEQSPLDTEGFASSPALAMVIAALRAKGDAIERGEHLRGGE